MVATEKWYLPDAIDIQVAISSGGHIVSLNVHPMRIEKIALGLTLLQQDLVRLLHFGSAHGKLSILKAEATAIDVSDQGLTLEVCGRDLETWLHFFLRAVRDGLPEVDHFDVETKDIKTQTTAFLTIRFNLAQP